MHKTISMNFLTLQGFSEKGKSILWKKKWDRAGGVGSEPGRPNPGGLPGLAHLNRYAAVRFRSNGARPFFSARQRMHASPAALARVWWGDAYRGAPGGRRRLDRWRRGSGDEGGPAGVHAEGLVLAGGVSNVPISSSDGGWCRRLLEGFRSIVNQKNSYGCEQESQDLI
jgi:hypothetical protein